MFNKQHFNYFIKQFLFSYLLLFLARGVFIFVLKNHNYSLIKIIETFVIGMFFDSSVLSIVFTIQLLILLVINKINYKLDIRFLKYSSSIIIFTIIFVNIIDIFFYKNYGIRSNSMVFNLFIDFRVIGKMIWDMYPIPILLLIFIFLFVIIYKTISIWINQIHNSNSSSIKHLSIIFISYIILSFQYIGPPFWYISSFSNSSLLNQASMNGIYTLTKSFQQELIYKRDLIEYNKNKENYYTKFLQKLVVKKNEKIIGSEIPTLRNNGIVSINKPKNLIIIICESFGTAKIGCITHDKLSCTPCFDSLAKNGILFTNCFSNGPRTQYAVVSVLGGFPAILSNNPIRRKGLNEFQSIANVLLKKNYSTNFITAGDVNYDDMDMYLKQGGFQNIYDEKNIREFRFKNEWGVSDEDMFDYALKKIGELKTPYFTSILTISNHSPWKLPEYFEKTHLEIKNYDKRSVMFYYADYAIGKFIRKLSKLDNSKNTIILIIADHGESITADDGQFKIFHIPALILNSAIKPVEFNKVCSQADMAPTLINLMGLNCNYHFVGQNIFSEYFHPFAVTRHYDPTLFYITDSVVCSWNINSNSYKYFYRNTTNYLIPCNKYLKNENISVGFVKDYAEAISYIYQTNKYRCE
jgi:phosphoglycerol transferase